MGILRVVLVVVTLIMMIHIAVSAVYRSHETSDENSYDIDSIIMFILAILIVAVFCCDYIPKGNVGIRINNPDQILASGFHMNIPKIIMLEDNEKTYSYLYQNNSCSIIIDIKYYNAEAQIEPLIAPLLDMTLQNILPQSFATLDGTYSDLLTILLQKECDEILGENMVFIRSVDIY